MQSDFWRAEATIVEDGERCHLYRVAPQIVEKTRKVYQAIVVQPQERT